MCDIVVLFVEITILLNNKKDCKLSRWTKRTEFKFQIIIKYMNSSLSNPSSQRNNGVHTGCLNSFGYPIVYFFLLLSINSSTGFVIWEANKKIQSSGQKLWIFMIKMSIWIYSQQLNSHLNMIGAYHTEHACINCQESSTFAKFLRFFLHSFQLNHDDV